MLKRVFVTFLFLMLMTAPFNVALSATPTCESLFISKNVLQRTGGAIVAKAKSVGSSTINGARNTWHFLNLPAHVAVYKIFFKPPSLEIDRTRHMLGILRQKENTPDTHWTQTRIPFSRVSKAIKYLKNTEITPMQAMGEWVDYGMRKITFERATFNGFSKFILFMGLTINAIDPAVSKFNFYLNKYDLQETALVHREDLNDSIRTDFRYAEINNKLVNKEIDENEALLRARSLSVNLSLYYELASSKRLEQEQATLESEIKDFGGQLFFIDIMEYVNNGVEKNSNDPSIVYSRVGQISNEQKILLFQLVHLRMSDLQFIDHIFSQANFESILESKSIPYFNWDHILGDYGAKLLSLYKEGKVSAAELRYLMQQDAFNRYQFSVLQAMGITKLDSEGNPITLSRARNNILSFLEE